MNERSQRMLNAIQKKGFSYSELERITGVSKSALQRYATGKTTKIPIDVIEKVAAATGTTSQYIMGWDDGTPEPNAAPANNIRMIPVFDSVSAGFGVGAVDRVTEYTPIAIDSDTEAAETICVRVCGDSMYPKIEDGDMVQVHKQETAETGDIVVILDGSEAFVKRFIRGKNGVVLESLNPAYPPRRYTREESNELRVVGIVKRVIRDI